MSNAKAYGAVAAAVALVALGVTAWLRGPDSSAAAAAAAASTSRPQADPMLEARTKGEPDAPIAIYEMSDFQCPFCRQFFEETWPLLQEEYVNTGKVRFTFVNLPLIQTHGNAAEAHEFAMCAASQGQFWPMHDKLFETQTTWAPMSDPTPHFVSLVEAAGMDREAMDQCLQSGAVRPIVAADVQAAIRNRLNSTPTFIVEGGILRGAAPIDDWRPILDSIYATKTGKN